MGTRRKKRDLRRLGRDRRGTTAVEFALLAPVLISLVVGTLEMINVALDFQRATEATRRAARILVMGNPVPDIQNIYNGGTVSCSGGGGSVSCSGASTDDPTALNDAYAAMLLIMPTLQPNNVLVTYEEINVGGGLSNAVTTLITVSLVNYQHDFLVASGLPGFPDSITFPSFATSRLAPTTPVP